MDQVAGNYIIGGTIGNGSICRVKIAEHVMTGHTVAIKILNRRKMNEIGTSIEEEEMREIEIHSLLGHPNILRIHETIETPSDIYVVMEYMDRGDLFDYIAQKGKLQEDEARNFFQQIIYGVEHCHRNKVVHGNLNMDNILLDSRGNLKITDFGSSKLMRDGHFLKPSAGHPNFASPEVISGNLVTGPEVDVWSCGVILYFLLCDALPFHGVKVANLFMNIKAGSYTLPSHLSPGAKELISRMLEVDPMKRITIPEIRRHRWLKSQLPLHLADFIYYFFLFFSLFLFVFHFFLFGVLRDMISF